MAGPDRRTFPLEGYRRRTLRQADLAFCAPGTAVLELLPESHVMPYWYTVSEAARLRYGYLMSDWVQAAPGGLSKDDLHVDPGFFLAALDDTVKSISTAGG